MKYPVMAAGQGKVVYPDPRRRACHARPRRVRRRTLGFSL